MLGNDVRILLSTYGRCCYLVKKKGRYSWLKRSQSIKSESSSSSWGKMMKILVVILFNLIFNFDAYFKNIIRLDFIDFIIFFIFQLGLISFDSPYSVFLVPLLPSFQILFFFPISPSLIIIWLDPTSYLVLFTLLLIN